MASDDITFGAASIATILWPEEGFDPGDNGGIVSVGEKLTKEFDDKRVFDELCDEFGFDKEHNKAYRHPNFELSRGNEHIRLTKFTDTQLNGSTAKDIILRVYVCNRIERRRAKITIFANFDFTSHPLNAVELTNFMGLVFNKEEDICKFIHEKIPDSYNLGDVKYISSIASVESGDENIDGIIESVLSRSDGDSKFEYTSNSGPVSENKILDAYYVLLSGKLLLSTDRGSTTPEKIQDAISKYKATQSKMIIYQANEKIPAKTLNYEINPDRRRVITNLTEPRCAPVLTNKLVNDYLSLT